MAKIAKLVCVSFMTRVIVEDTDTTEQILDKCRDSFHLKVDTELNENLEYIDDDLVIPFSESDLSEIKSIELPIFIPKK